VRASVRNIPGRSRTDGRPRTGTCSVCGDVRAGDPPAPTSGAALCCLPGGFGRSMERAPVHWSVSGAVGLTAAVGTCARPRPTYPRALGGAPSSVSRGWRGLRFATRLDPRGPESWPGPDCQQVGSNRPPLASSFLVWGKTPQLAQAKDRMGWVLVQRSPAEATAAAPAHQYPGGRGCCPFL
jgi:hypothetical protein